MVKKVIYAIIAIAVVVAGYIGVKRLNYWERSARIFSYDSSQAIDGRGGRGFEGGPGGREAFEGREGFQRPDFRQIPDSIRARFEARGQRPPREGNRNFPDSLRQRNFRNPQGQPFPGENGAVQNFEGRPQRREADGDFRGGGRGGERGGKQINLRNIYWFLAVFAAFTVITIYADKCYVIIKKRLKRNKKN
jgi:hypothetical protein